MAYGELVKKFENVREYMREFFVFGFKNREEVGRKSARSYDNERRRIESWLGDSMSFSRSANGKAQFISVDTRKVPCNPLYNAFKAKSFTDKDIVLHFILLDILSEDIWLSFAEIVNVFFTEYTDKFEYSLEMEPPVIRNKLNEYVKEGIIECKKERKNSYYRKVSNRVSVDTWKEAIPFYSEVGTLGVIGSYLLDNPALKGLDKHTSKYRFKHHYLVHVLESQILCQVFEAMNAKKFIRISVVNRRTSTKTQFTTYPVKIYESTQNGRMYVLGYDGSRDNFNFFRLDNIVEVRELECLKNDCVIQKKYEEIIPYLWGVSINNSKHLEHLEVFFIIKKRDVHILDRLHKEKRNGRIIELGRDRYKYEVDTFDAMELLPWIRSFIGKIEKLDCTNQNVQRVFYKDLEEMRRMYIGGVESDF